MLSIEEAAKELGESVQLTRWLIEVGRLPDPPTLDAVQAYRDAPDKRPAGIREQIQPGELRHLYGERVTPPS